MAVRTAYVGTQSPGEVLTSANFTKLPGGWIGYAEVTANQGTFTAATDLTSLTVGITAGTSRRIHISGVIALSTSAGGDRGTLFIKESTTQLQDCSGYLGIGSVGFTMRADVVLTPSAGAHTYKLTAQRTAGSGNLTMIAASTAPAYIYVTDDGPSS